MQRGEHQVSSESRLDSDFSGFKVANLADQNDVRILPQKCAQGSGKVQANRFFHLDLIHAVELELNWSSAVMMLVSGWFRREIGEYRVLVFPGPGGPGTKN